MTIAQLEKKMQAFRKEVVDLVTEARDHSRAADSKADAFLAKVTASKFTYLIVAAAIAGAFFLGQWVG